MKKNKNYPKLKKFKKDNVIFINIILILKLLYQLVMVLLISIGYLIKSKLQIKLTLLK